MSCEQVRKSKCATCPFREGSPYEHLRDYLTEASLKQGRICHSTGVSAIKQTKLPEKICRGSRDLQLAYMHAAGVIEQPTDAAWSKKWEEVKKQNKANQ